MNKLAIGALLAATAAVVVAVPIHNAEAQRTPPPPIKIAPPSFSCAATVGSTTGTATMTKTNSTAVDPTKDVVAVVNTPSGKVTAAVCGSAFTSSAIGTKATASFSVPSTSDKDWIYTCSASQTQTTAACNPPR